jgi:hypothetical protein
VPAIDPRGIEGNGILMRICYPNMRNETIRMKRSGNEEREEK